MIKIGNIVWINNFLALLSLPSKQNNIKIALENPEGYFYILLPDPGCLILKFQGC